MKTKIEELVKQLQECRNRIDENVENNKVTLTKMYVIENEIAKLKEKEEKKEFPQDNQIIYTPNLQGDVISLTYYDSQYNFLKEQGVVFPTSELCEQYVLDVKKKREILDRINELNGNWKADFDGDNTNYCFGLYGKNNKLNTGFFSYTQYQPLEYYFKSGAIGAQLVVEFGEDLKLLIK